MRAALLAERAEVAPGERLRLAVRLEIAPGWHTYWRNPGDAGLPTRVDWALPAGWTVGDLGWPAPVRFVTSGVVSYGYAGEVTLPVVVQVPITARRGDRLTVRAHVRWVGCAAVCVPGGADLARTVRLRTREEPVSARVPTRPTVPRDRESTQRTGDEVDAVRLALDRIPGPLDTGWAVTATRSGADVVLTLASRARGIAAPRALQVYPSEPGVVTDVVPHAVARTSTMLRVRLAGLRAITGTAEVPPGDAAFMRLPRLRALLVLDAGWPGFGAAGAAWIDVPIAAPDTQVPGMHWRAQSHPRPSPPRQP